MMRSQARQSTHEKSGLCVISILCPLSRAQQRARARHGGKCLSY